MEQMAHGTINSIVSDTSRRVGRSTSIEPLTRLVRNLSIEIALSGFESMTLAEELYGRGKEVFQQSGHW